MDSSKQFKIKLALWVCAGMQTSHLVLTSALAKVADYFPATGLTTIQMIPTMTSLAVIPCAFLSGPLSQKISKRAIVLFSLICIMTGGILPLLFHQSIPLLMSFSLLAGVGVGLISPTISGIITDVFSGSERSKELGRQASALSIGGMVMTFLGGWLANSQWFNAYWSYLLVIPVFTAAFMILPKSVSQGTDNTIKPKMKLNRKAIFVCVLSMAFGIVFNIFGTNISLLIKETGITNTAFSGGANVALMAGGFLSGIIFFKITSFLKQKSFIFIFLACSTGYFIFALFCNLVLVYCVCFVIGLCNGLFLSHGNKTLSSLIDARSLPLGMGLFISFNHIGLFLSPIIFSGLSGLTNQTSASIRFGLGAVLSLIVVIILLLYYNQNKNICIRNPEFENK